MALCRGSPLVEVVSGAVGGVVFYTGGRRGVVGRRGRKPGGASESQIARREGFARAVGYWNGLSASGREAWSMFGRSVGRVNRVGTAGYLGGRQAWIEEYLSYDPDGSIGGAPAVPRGYARVPRLTVSSVVFVEGGPYNVTIAALPGYGVHEYCFCRRWAAYGDRWGAGAMTFIGRQRHGALTLNWYSLFQAKGLSLAAGEVVELRFYWRETFYAGSGSVWVQETVSA